MSRPPARSLPLSDREAEVCALFALDGLSIEDTAVASGLTYDTVKSYLKRSRQKYGLRGIDAGNKFLLGKALAADGFTPRLVPAR